MLNSRSWVYLGLGTIAIVATGNAIATIINDWQVICLAVVLGTGALVFFNARQKQVLTGQQDIPTDRAGLQKQLQQVNQIVAKVSDERLRQDLWQQAEQIAANLKQDRFRIAVFGTGSAGKTSVINALLGRVAGTSAPTVGTTTASREYAFAFHSKSDGKPAAKEKTTRQILLVDTPGIQEAGCDGLEREGEAQTLARASDLLVFVTSGDLAATEHRELVKLSGLGKRIILAFNKTDCYLPSDREVVLARLRDRTQGFLALQDIVAIAAQPSPIVVRQYDSQHPDNSTAIAPAKEWLEPLPPDIATLRERIEQILSVEWEQLLIANTHLQIQALRHAAQNALQQLRRIEAEKIVTRYQWMTAATVFANPLIGLDLVASAAMNAQLLIELSRLYERPLSLKQAKQTATVITKALLQLGCVEAATAAIATCLKTNALTYAIGGSVQAIAAAYLTHIGGIGFLDYLEQEEQAPVGANDTIKTLHVFCQNSFRNMQGNKFFSDFVSGAVAHLSGNLKISAFGR